MGARPGLGSESTRRRCPSSLSCFGLVWGVSVPNFTLAKHYCYETRRNLRWVLVYLQEKRHLSDPSPKVGVSGNKTHGGGKGGKRAINVEEPSVTPITLCPRRGLGAGPASWVADPGHCDPEPDGTGPLLLPRRKYDHSPLSPQVPFPPRRRERGGGFVLRRTVEGKLDTLVSPSIVSTPSTDL